MYVFYENYLLSHCMHIKNYKASLHKFVAYRWLIYIAFHYTDMKRLAKVSYREPDASVG